MATTRPLYTCHKHLPVLSSFILITGFVTRVTRCVPLVEQPTAYPTGTHEFTPGFSGVRVAWSKLVFCEMFCRSLFVPFLLVVVLCVLLRYTDSDYPLVSSNSYSYKSTIEVFNLQGVCSKRVTRYGTWSSFSCYDLTPPGFSMSWDLWTVTTIKASNEIFNERKYPDIKQQPYHKIRSTNTCVSCRHVVMKY